MFGWIRTRLQGWAHRVQQNRRGPSPPPPSPVRAADRLLKARQVVIPKCGHAPQIEKSRLVNELVLRFLRDGLKNIPPMLDPVRFLRGGNGARERMTGARP